MTKLEIILYYIMHTPYYVKKHCYCRFVHKNHRCYPRDPNGQWHCAECHPCSEGLMKLIKKAEKMKKKELKNG